MDSISTNGKTMPDLHELKLQAMDYYAQNGVPKKMEDVLNTMFFDKPNDVYGHLVNYFEEFTKTPTISKLSSHVVVDSRGQPAVQTKVYCTIRNHVKLVSVSCVGNESYPPDTMKLEDRDAAELEQHESVSAAVEYIGADLSLALWGTDPTKQDSVDQLLLSTLREIEEKKAEETKTEADQEKVEEAVTETQSPTQKVSKKGSAKGRKSGKEPIVIVPDEPREKFFPGCSAVSAVSKAVCEAAARITDTPLYYHIALLHSKEEWPAFSLPQLMVTIISSGKTSPGKLNGVKEFMVIPSASMNMTESLRHITDIYNKCSRSLAAKGAASLKSSHELGSLCPQFDRVEQGLDLLQDAITQLNLEPGKDFFVALNCGGPEVFDHDKNKYELVAGQQKTADDVADFWADVVKRYPFVIALIDPFRKQEAESWSRLYDSVSDHCLVVGDLAYHRPGLLKDEKLELRSSGVVLKMEHVNSVSDVLTAAQKIQESDHHVIISASYGEPADAFIADLAVGCRARFLKLGGPTRGERVCKLNRLIDIEDELKNENKLTQSSPLAFPSVKLPTPIPSEEEQSKDTEDQKSEK